ncbi:TIGR03086 family metal-binding protein [Nocardioides sp. zg-1228]|uniref:TIGR03086 family metal-binding protein n=1 Tax=Nocardioides sp. zg-1228 TaxID=2763008 RepID=UPI0016430EB7|nr:TIGR03086 family metal-binding protein [Nocardioides sp. zg-1228]MBC2934161.1 TIGR03086 family protein [Nocardioides sp. zg-1228]QSF58906.1 TIGR03086 family protein [Nocardioides sp. zg-1228]
MTQTTTSSPTPSPAHQLSLFQQRADRFARVLDAVEVAGGDWDVPSPCEGWTARDVVGHVIETQRDFLRQRDLDAGPDPDLADPAAAWRRQRAHVTSVLADGVAAREYDSYFGPTTIAATIADFYGWDLVVHGSDVARATGQEWTVSDEEAAALHATADGWGDTLHSEGICAPAVEVGPDASVTDRLLARLGRDPGWRPAR